MFGHRYFGARYFSPRYFGPEVADAEEESDPTSRVAIVPAENRTVSLASENRTAVIAAA